MCGPTRQQWLLSNIIRSHRSRIIYCPLVPSVGSPNSICYNGWTERYRRTVTLSRHGDNLELFNRVKYLFTTKTCSRLIQTALRMDLTEVLRFGVRRRFGPPWYQTRDILCGADRLDPSGPRSLEANWTHEIG